jgi:multiple sugar transport system substrate-binding protein
MKKATIIGMVVLLTVLLPLGAQGNQEPVPVDLSAPVKLTIWTHEDANRSVLEKRLIEEFTRMNPNVTVDYQTYPSGKMR